MKKELPQSVSNKFNVLESRQLDKEEEQTSDGRWSMKYINYWVCC